MASRILMVFFGEGDGTRVIEGFVFVKKVLEGRGFWSFKVRVEVV